MNFTELLWLFGCLYTYGSLNWILQTKIFIQLLMNTMEEPDIIVDISKTFNYFVKPLETF